MYEKLAGMTGTAVTEAEEFDKIYKLEVIWPSPPTWNTRPSRPDSGLREHRSDRMSRLQIHLLRPPDDADKQAGVLEAQRLSRYGLSHRGSQAARRDEERSCTITSLGRPILVGTTSVELSDRVSTRLRAEPLRRLAQVLLLREVWFDQNNREEDGRQVA